jgi:hypothetical protein
VEAIFYGSKEGLEALRKFFKTTMNETCKFTSEVKPSQKGDYKVFAVVSVVVGEAYPK